MINPASYHSNINRNNTLDPTIITIIIIVIITITSKVTTYIITNIIIIIIHHLENEPSHWVGKPARVSAGPKPG